MIRKSLLLLALLLSSSTFAATRAVNGGTRITGGATVGGIVSSVSGNLIHLAGGAITIDATGAKINFDKGRDGTTANIEPGMIVFATLTRSDIAPNAALPAASISVTRLPDGTLFGPVQSVDLAGSSITLLGRTIQITAETSIGGVQKTRDGSRPDLSDILPNHIVQVTLDATGAQLVATSVLLLAPAPPEVHATRGTVRSIGTNSWLIDRERGDDITVVIDAQTKIVGSPKVGDTVELLYRIDSSNALVAISIIRFEPPKPPQVDIFRFSGRVESMEPQVWVVAKAEGERIKLRIEKISKIDAGIRVGDDVEVLAQRNSDGSATALAIVRRLL